MIRAVLAVVFGTVAAFVAILVVEAIGSVVAPGGVAPSPNDAVAMRGYLATLPVGAYAFVVAAYLVGSAVGGTVAIRTGAHRGPMCAWIVGAFVLAATIANLVMIPHPAWFATAAVAAVIVGAFAATRFGATLPTGRAP